MLNDLAGDLIPQFCDGFPADLFRVPRAADIEEPRGRWAGQGGLVARPGTAEQVAALVRRAADLRVGIVPMGGGTGLVGGQLMPEGPAPLLLSLERMTTVRAVNPSENALVAEAGAVLTDVQDAARAAGRVFALSLASEGSARIGGLLATNAGGTGTLRYGNARALCLGVEAVLPNGDILRWLTRLRKDNSGYDLRNLLIGSEGTLGVITAAALQLHAAPDQVGVALLAVPDPAAALSLLEVTRAHVGDGVSAFELIHRQGLDFIAQTGLPIRNPWPQTPEWCVLVELGLFGQNAGDMLGRIFETGAGRGLVADGLVAQNAGQADDFWSVREHIPEANRKIGAVSSHDISLPLGALPEFIARANEAIAALGPFRVNCFGHVGDGNLHFNVFPPQGRTRADFADRRDEIKRTVHDLVHQMGGSVSAEHGVGRLKVDDLERYGDPAKLAAMRAIKRALDPCGIMNPGAVLRPDAV